MKNIRVVILIVITLVVAFFVGSAIRSYYLFLKEPVSNIVNALPPNTAVVLKTNSVNGLFAGMDKSGVSASFEYNADYIQIRAYLDTLAKKNENFDKILNNHEVIFAFMNDFTNSPGMLALTPVGKTSAKSLAKDLRETLGKGYSVTKADNGLYRLEYKNSNVWYYVKQGILAISKDSSLVQDSYNALSSDNGLANDSVFMKLLSTGGKRVEANLFINNKQAASIIWPAKSALLDNTPFAQWSSFDVNMHNGQVQLGGFTLPATEHLFTGQKPVEYDELGSLPVNAAFVITIAISDQITYTRQFLRNDTIGTNGFDTSMNTETTEIFNSSEHIRSWIGSTVSSIYTDAWFNGSKHSHVVMIAHTNADSALAFLKPFLVPQTDSLFRLTYPQLSADLWGPIFSIDGQVFCRITETHVLLSSDNMLLSDYGKTSLTSAPDFNILKESTGNSSNLFIYLKPQLLASWFASENAKAPSGWTSFLTSNASIGLQYSCDGKLQYTHAWMVPGNNSQQLVIKAANSGLEPAQANTKIGGQADSQAEIRKETTEHKESAEIKISSNTELKESAEESKASPNKVVSVKGVNKPTVINAGTGKAERLVLTGENTIAMYDVSGKQLWSFKTDDNLMPGMQEIKYNRQTHFFVPTRKHFHILDQNGKEITSSPVKLPQPAKGAFTLVDYDKRYDYRILYVANDSKLYNIDINGKQPADWQKPSVSGNGNITFFRTGGRDYLVYMDSNKELKVFDRKGKLRIKTDNRLSLSSRSGLFENKTNSKGIFLGAAINGDLLYLNTDGTYSTSSFGNFEDNPWFWYADYDGDGSYDFLFAESARISIYSKMKNVIAQKAVKGKLTTPYVYRNAAGDIWIFALNTSNNEVVILNKGANKSTQKVLKSETSPVVITGKVDNTSSKPQEMLVTMLKGKMVLTPLSELKK